MAALSSDLDFHQDDSSYASHNFHSFPAKFPPQLPRRFIEALTEVGDIVLDPMMGSGTTVVEAALLQRHAIGLDIDPLATHIARTKVTHLDTARLLDVGNGILRNASEALAQRHTELAAALEARWDTKTKEFVDYWFARQTQLELLALAQQIEAIQEPDVRKFFELAFSAIIITKSGGVSLALDLAHTRPHRAKRVTDEVGNIIILDQLSRGSSRNLSFLTKSLRSPLVEFSKRFRQNLQGVSQMALATRTPLIAFGDAQCMPLRDGTVDLIVTSPPYAANAIDYMRAHKFSMVWLHRSVTELGEKRKDYIGGESVSNSGLLPLPEYSAEIVAAISRQDRRKGLVLHRYYSEMTLVLAEMWRVLKPGRAAIVVVGSSTMRGQDTMTDLCLADIGRSLGFAVPRIAVRNLDRNRRMMPAGAKLDPGSQIQKRMHEEYIIGFLKPS